MKSPKASSGPSAKQTTSTTSLVFCTQPHLASKTRDSLPSPRSWSIWTTAGNGTRKNGGSNPSSAQVLSFLLTLISWASRTILSTTPKQHSVIFVTACNKWVKRSESRSWSQRRIGLSSVIILLTRSRVIRRGFQRVPRDRRLGCSRLRMWLRERIEVWACFIGSHFGRGMQGWEVVAGIIWWSSMVDKWEVVLMSLILFEAVRRIRVKSTSWSVRTVNLFTYYIVKSF